MVVSRFALTTGLSIFICYPQLSWGSKESGWADKTCAPLLIGEKGESKPTAPDQTGLDVKPQESGQPSASEQTLASTKPLSQVAEAAKGTRTKGKWQGMTVVLDTNVLLINPRAMFDFPGAQVIIHNQVLRELDKKKRADRPENRNVAANARRAARAIEELQKGHVGDPKTKRMEFKQSGGLIVFDTNDHLADLPEDLKRGSLFSDDPDDRIIATAIRYAREIKDRNSPFFSDRFSKGTIFISQDVQAKTKTRVLGVKSEEYESLNSSASRDEINSDAIYSGWSHIQISDEFYAHLSGLKEIARVDLEARLGMPTKESLMLFPNQYIVFLRPRDTAALQEATRLHPGRSLTASVDKDQLVGVYNAWNDTVELVPLSHQFDTAVKPRNVEQRMLLHALLSKRIRQVTVMGRAGTGKTLLALAAGKYQTDSNLRQADQDSFKQMILMRSLATVGGEQIGFLPGTEKEKINPQMESYYDNLEVLLSLERRKGGNGGGADSKPISIDKAVAQYLESGLVQLQVMGFIRGRSIQNRFIIIDEAQNVDPGGMKTILTRPGEGTKLVVMGDIGQIDQPYLNLYNNGVTDFVSRLKHRWDVARENGTLNSDRRLHISAVIRLEQGERSELAEFMTELYESEDVNQR